MKIIGPSLAYFESLCSLCRLIKNLLEKTQMGQSSSKGKIVRLEGHFLSEVEVFEVVDVPIVW